LIGNRVDRLAERLGRHGDHTFLLDLDSPEPAADRRLKIGRFDCERRFARL